MAPPVQERIAALETRCDERGKVIDKLDASVTALEGTIAELNGTLRLALFKVHMIWLGAAAALNLVTLIVFSHFFGKG